MATVQGNPGLASVLQAEESVILANWTTIQLADSQRRHLLSDVSVQAQSRDFLGKLSHAVRHDFSEGMTGVPWDEVRSELTELSRQRARAGFTPTETATFIFSLKEALFAALRRNLAHDALRLNEESWLTGAVVDKLGLLTMEAWQKGREQVIKRQQQELLDLSTPVVKLWDGIVAVPLIGTLDSARTHTVMETLLTAIAEDDAKVAIIDITGVPTVDTLTAQHLLQTVAAARLMGAECIISGIRPQIAQTIVHLGVDLGDVMTKASLAEALRVALARRNLEVVERPAKPRPKT